MPKLAKRTLPEQRPQTDSERTQRALSGSRAAAQGDPAAITAATVSTSDAATQTGSYVQADVQTCATLANANKVEINKLITDVTDTRLKLTELIDKLQTAKQMAT